MRKNLLIFAVLVTAVALVAGSFALPAMAAESAAPVTETAEQTGVSVVSEDVSLRGEYEKHFLMSDGSYQAVVYSEPVHELVDGAWVEITSTNQNARDSATTDNTKSNIIDNYVLQGGGVQNKSLDRLYIGNRSAGLTRAYIQFATMPTIPEGSTITSATMTLHLTSGTSTAANASAYMVTGGEWASGTIQWSNMPAANALLQGDISHNNVTGYTFSCLMAVQTWYNGDPTGQHNNYGIMLKYANESIDDYNAVYSADYTDANKRPKLTISYTISQVSVVEGYIKKLPFSETTETITWASSDTGIAIATSGGNVIGVKAGTAIVTGTVNGEVMYTYTVRVFIEDGVYYIKSGDSVSLGTSGQVAEGTDTSLQTLATSGRAQLNQLWRITYLSNGYYSIRPLYKPDMGLCSKDGAPGAVEITSIGMTDTLSGVPGMNRWTIEKNGDAYSLYCAGTSNMTMRFSTPYPGASVVTQSYTTSLSGFVWELEKTTSVTTQVLLLDTETGASAEGVTKYIEPDETVTLADLGLAAYFVCAYDSDQAITWEPLSTSVVTVDSENGTVTGLTAGGTTTITAKYNYNGTDYGKNYQITIAVVPSGVYFIENSASNRYLQIDNDDSTNNFNTSGSSMVQWSYVGGDYQKWILNFLEDGYYSIVSVQSGLALSVPSGQTTSVDVSLVQQAYYGYDRQKWAIMLTDEGYYKVKPKSSETLSNDLVMAVGNSDVNVLDGVDVQQRVYSNDTTYTDEWDIQLAHPLDLVVYFDIAYRNRMGSSANAIAEIEEQLEIVKKVYWERFSVAVSYSTPSQYATYANVHCTTSPTETCNHEGECADSESLSMLEDIHHTNITNILLRMPVPEAPTEASIIYIGHYACANTDNGHEDYPYWGLAYFNLGIIGINNMSTDYYCVGTVIHEIGHLFGAPDHYGDLEMTTNEINDLYETRKFSRNCIFGEDKDTQVNAENYVICEGCCEAIRENVERYFDAD